MHKGSDKYSKQSMVYLATMSANLIVNYVVVWSFGYVSWSDTTPAEWLTQLAVNAACALAAFHLAGYYAKVDIVLIKVSTSCNVVSCQWHVVAWGLCKIASVAEGSPCGQVRAKETKNIIRFLYHDLRTPLQTIAVGIQLLVKYLQHDNACREDISERDEQSADVVDSMHRACDAVLSTLDNLLLVVRIEGNSLDVFINTSAVAVETLVLPCIAAHQEQVGPWGVL